MPRPAHAPRLIRVGLAVCAVAVGATVLGDAQQASASESVSNCAQINERTRFSGSGAIDFEFPMFNPATGNLVRASVTTRVRSRWDDRGEIDSNDNGNPYIITATRSATAVVEFNGLTPAQEVTATGTYVVDDLNSEESIEEPIGTDIAGDGGVDVPNDDGFRRIGESPEATQINEVDLAAVIGTSQVTATVSGFGASNFDGADNAQLNPTTFVKGEICITYEFERFVSIGNYVWLDVNRDGRQGTTEPPVQGVTVTSETAGLPPVSALTDGVGAYAFTDLLGGRPYDVRFTPPPGYSFTTSNVGTDDADSDVDASGVTTVTAPSSGANSAAVPDDPTIDAGLVAYDLALAKEVVSTGPFAAGSLVRYRLIPRNLGPTDALAGWSVTEVPPPGSTFIAMTGSGYDCADMVCTALSPLPAGTAADPIEVTLTLGDENGVMRNVAYVAPSPSDVSEIIPLGVAPVAGEDTGLTTTNNDAHADVSGSVYDLAIVKTVRAADSDGSELSIFTITVRNQGSVPSGAITVTDHVPAGATVSFASDGGLTATDGRQVTWEIGNIPSGQSNELTLVLELGGDGTYVNIAEISSDNASSYGGDIDSVADLNPTNDVLIDLLVLPPDGLNDPAVDEDDHDVAIVELKRPAVTTLPISVQSPTLTLPATGRSSTGTTSALALALLVAGLAALYAARTQPDHR